MATRGRNGGLVFNPEEKRERVPEGLLHCGGRELTCGTLAWARRDRTGRRPSDKGAALKCASGRVSP